MKEEMTRKGKWISSGGYGRYFQPAGAIVGASDTGYWSDSPAPTLNVIKEINMVKKELANLGIPTKQKVTRSSNEFIFKRWLITSPKKEIMGKQRVKELMKKIKSKISYIHEAD